MCAWTHNKVFWCHCNLQFLGMTILNALVFHFKYEYISIVDERVLNRNLTLSHLLKKKKFFPFLFNASNNSDTLRLHLMESWNRRNDLFFGNSKWETYFIILQWNRLDCKKYATLPDNNYLIWRTKKIFWKSAFWPTLSDVKQSV